MSKVKIFVENKIVQLNYVKEKFTLLTIQCQNWELEPQVPESCQM